MSEVTALKIAVGDKVRVHFHPPGSMRSFCEGVVSRVDVTTAEGRFFAVEVEHEVILDREHRTRPGFHDYVRYNCPNDFAGRIEILATIEEAKRELGPSAVPVQPSLEAEQEANELHRVEPEIHPDPETGSAPEAEAASQLTQADIEPRTASGMMAALFGLKR